MYEAEASTENDQSTTYVPSEATTSAGSSLPLWLNSSRLPEAKYVRLLVERYFQHVHPLRCFAFIHKPTFLDKLDDLMASADVDTPLLQIVCALGAQFYALEYSDTVQSLPSSVALDAGSQWAGHALRTVTNDLNTISVEYLMAFQLLYDYALRKGNFAQAFMLSSMMTRIAQALQINLEYSTDVLNKLPDTRLSVTARESRRRLMWSCWATDALCGSGVDQLTLIKDYDVKIQLPTREREFILGLPQVTVTLGGSALPFLDTDIIPTDSKSCIGIAAYFIQHIEVRKRVLKYIKHLDKAQQPWHPNSEFALLDTELKSWYDALPDNIRFNSTTVYMRKETNQLGALCLLHCAYQQTLCDLYRLGAPTLYKLKSAFTFPPEQNLFLKQLQWSLFKAARGLATVMAEGERHGSAILADTWFPTIAYDSNRIMLYYLTNLLEPHEPQAEDLIMKTIPHLQSNVRVLRVLRATNLIADGLHRAADAMLRKVGVDSGSIRLRANVVLEDPYLSALSLEEASETAIPLQSAPDYVLNPLSIYRMARNQIPERHAAEGTVSHSPSCQSHANNVSPESMQLPGTQSYSDPNDFDCNNADLSMFFAPDLGWDWQPAETVLASGMNDDGILPWIGGAQMNFMDMV